MFCCCSWVLSQDIWGMNMPNLPEVSYLGTSWLLFVFVTLASRQLTLLWWRLSSRDEYCRDTHNVLMMPLSRSSARPPCGSGANRHGSPCHVRRMLVSWALWRFTMMVSIAFITIIDGIDWAHRDWWWRRCLLLLVATVPSSNAFIVLTARIFNSLITIQTELSLEWFLLLLLLYKAIDQSSWSGCVVCCWLVQSIVANETFLHAIFVDNRQAHGLFKVQAKVFLMELSKLRIRLSRACLSPPHSMVDFRVTLVTQE